HGNVEAAVEVPVWGVADLVSAPGHRLPGYLHSTHVEVEQHHEEECTGACRSWDLLGTGSVGCGDRKRMRERSGQQQRRGEDEWRRDDAEPTDEELEGPQRHTTAERDQTIEAVEVKD